MTTKEHYPCGVCAELLNATMCQSGIIKDGVELPAHVACADQFADSEVTVFVLKCHGFGVVIDRNVETVIEQIQNMEDDEKFTVSKKKMKRGEYETLPEFEGF